MNILFINIFFVGFMVSEIPQVSVFGHCPYSVTFPYIYSKAFPKERYNTYAKSCNSNLYTKYPGATYSGLLLGTMRCL